MPYGIFVWGLAGREKPEVKQWLQSYDPDAFDGDGGFTFTRHKEHALLFPSMLEALATVKRQSTRRPLRDDGEPNRPLTAFTVEIRRL